MNEVKAEHLDHPGVVAGVIKDPGIVEMIDARIPGDEQENVTRERQLRQWS